MGEKDHFMKEIQEKSEIEWDSSGLWDVRDKKCQNH